jgi:sugar phosphate isomerase/epimerase
MMLARREMLCGGVALAMTAAPAPAVAHSRRPLGLADITVLKELGRDYAGTLRQAAGMGYTHLGFRLASYGPSNTEHSPREKAKMVRDAGLEVGVVRFSPVSPDHDGQIAQAVDIGARIIAMSAAPVFISRQLGVTTRSAFDAWLPQLAALGAKCRAAGLRFAYHTHWWDFMPLEGGDAPLDIIASSTAPSDVAFELDLAWAWYGGAAPLAVLAKLGPRVASMHLKDIDRSRGKTIADHAVVLGTGEMDYAALLPRIARLTQAVGYVEVDSPDDGLAAARAGARFFREHR